MNRIAITIAAIMLGLSAYAQTLHVKNGNVSYNFPASITGTMEFGADNTLTIAGKSFSLNNDSSMWVDNATVKDNTVTVTYSETEATVDIAGNIAPYVEAEVNGANVTLTQSSEVSEATCGEISYILSGSSANGSFYLSGSYKSTVELQGVTLTNPSGAAIDIQNGKRIAMRLTGNNSLTDGTGSQKGCVICKGHLELKGTGELTVAGNTTHAIYAKEYIELKDCTVNVTSAVKDGVNCNQYFTMKSGSLSIKGTGDDGIQVSYKDETDREAEDTGMVTIKGGTVTVETTADATKGIKCEGPMLISGGEINVTVKGNGVWDSAKSKTKAAACLGGDETITIEGGTLNLTATGGGGKGINCDGALTINNGDIDIRTSGGVVAYVNGVLSNNYTGSTDRLDSDLKSSPKGIKADGNIDINGGTLHVTTTGNGAEGIESKSVLTINDGTVVVAATDDAINSSSHMYIKGGNVTVIASGNDGLDTNGNLYIEGGYIMAFGARSPECGIDANEEDGYTVIFSGGTLLAVGGGNSVPSSKSGSTQPYVSASKTVSAGNEVTLTDSNGTTLATFTVPANYSSSSSGSTRPGMGGSSGSLLITCPGLVSGSSYTLKAGTSSSSVSAKLTGTSGRP